MSGLKKRQMLKDRVKIKESISKDEKNLVNLSLGKKKPKTEKDKKHLAEIDEIKRRGGSLYIPHD
jgi:hypothetical protein